MSVFILPKIYVGSSNKEKKINECTRSSCTVLLRKIMEKKTGTLYFVFCSTIVVFVLPLLELGNRV